MSAKGHRWVGLWKRQVCKVCGAIRSSAGLTQSIFSTDNGRTWSGEMPACRKVQP